MRVTTLCYIEKDDKYLMLHRVKKENDANRDKWIGIGGGIEPGETPEMCLLREVHEEVSRSSEGLAARICRTSSPSRALTRHAPT